MKRIIFFLSLLASCMAISAQNDAERTLVLTGEIFNKFDSTYVAHAHVIKVHSNEATITTDRGYFGMVVGEWDTIRISAIGYHEGFIYIKDIAYEEDIHLNIYLQPQVYELDSVTVNSFMSKEDFRQAFRNMELKPAEDSIYLNLPDPSKYNIVTSPSGQPVGGITVSGPISAIYNAFSKKAKHEREYKALMAREQLAEKNERKYNVDFVKRVTGLVDEEVIEDFMRFCNLPETYVDASTEYELVLALEECYARYTATTE